MKVVCNCFLITKGNDLISELIVKHDIAEFKCPKRQKKWIVIFQHSSTTIIIMSIPFSCFFILLVW